MKNMTVAARLGWSFAALLALLLGVALVGLSRLSELNESIGTVVNDRAPKLEALHDIAYHAMDNARIVRNIILLTDETARAANVAAYAKNQDLNAEHLKYLKDQLKDPDDLALLAEVDARRADYNRYTAEVLKFAQGNQNGEAIKVLYGERYKTQGAYFAAINKLVDAEKLKLAAAAADAEQRYTSARNLVIGLGVLAAALGSVMAWRITRGLQRQLGGEPDYATRVAQRIAGGDLSQPVQTRAGDTTSLVAAMAAMQGSLSQVVASVRSNSESVATASAQIAQGNQDLSQRTEEQASALQQTAASMEQLSSTVRQNADNARQANQLAQGATSVAVQGGEVVGQVVDTMKQINDSSKKIADIIGVIDGIAFQTNILALNAAVEAARAGEQGRGFAVVASEVRSLAGRSADAAREIKTLITASVERVEQGTTLVERAGTTMTEVVGAVKRVTDIMGEISAASVEQSSGVTQVGDAVAQMDRATQQNAALVEQSAAAAESLKSQAQHLVQTVAVFRLTTGSGAAVPSAAAKTAPAPRATASTPVRHAPNPSRSPARPASAGATRPAAEPAPAKPGMARTGTDDGWSTF